MKFPNGGYAPGYNTQFLTDVESGIVVGVDVTNAVAQWRERMADTAAKQIYKLRAQTAEWVNALCRNRGLWQMPVRGRPKCRIVALLYAITHNLMQAANLRAQAATMST